MPFGTFGELKAAIASELARGDLTSQIPDFVKLCEARLRRRFGLNGLSVRATATATAADPYVSMPTDFLRMRRMQVNSDPVVLLDYVTPPTLSRTYAGSSTGKPRVFSIEGGQFRLGPTPDSAYTLEMEYAAKVTALSADSDTNSILTNHPDLYHYGSLIAAAHFIQDDARIGTWKALYEDAAREVEIADEREKYPSGVKAVRSEYRGA